MDIPKLTVFSRLTVIARGDKPNHSICTCVCGNKLEVNNDNLKYKTTKSCGCLRGADLLNMRFGRLLVVEYAGRHAKLKEKQWKCKCDCGKFRLTRTSPLKSGNTQSCGCLQGESLLKAIRIEKGQAGLNKLFSVYKTKAKDRNHSFSLNISEFKEITSKNCIYCGDIPRHYSLTNEHSRYLYNGIDRMDNKIGYELNNVVPCCVLCNYAKGSRLSYEEMLLVGPTIAIIKENRRKKDLT